MCFLTHTKRRFAVVLSILSLASLASFATWASDSTTVSPIRNLTLSKTIELALNQNRDVMTSQLDISKANAQVREAWSYALPQVDISSTYQRNSIAQKMLFNGMFITTVLNNTYSTTANLTQPLLSRKVGIGLDIAKTYREFYNKSYQSTQENTIRNVTKAFYLALLTKKLVDVNREGYNVVKANRDNVQSMYTNGMAAEFDLLRAEVQVANTEPIVISAENNYQLAMNALKNLLAFPLTEELSLEGELEYTAVSNDEIASGDQTASSMNSTLQQLRIQESLLQKNTAIEKANYFPTLYLIGSYGWQTQDNTFKFNNYQWSDAFAYGLSLSFTPFDGFRTAAKVQQADVDQKKVKLTRIKAEEGLQLQIESAVDQLTEASKRIQAQSEGRKQAEKALQISQTRFQNGIGTQLELLDTQVAMTRAQTNYSTAIYDYLTAKTDWQYYVGKLHQ